MVKKQRCCWLTFAFFFYYFSAMLPVRAKMINTMSKMCSGARRSFFCRMKCKVYSVKEEADTTTGSKYTQSGNFFFVRNVLSPFV